MREAKKLEIAQIVYLGGVSRCREPPKEIPNASCSRVKLKHFPDNNFLYRDTSIHERTIPSRSFLKAE